MSGLGDLQAAMMEAVLFDRTAAIQDFADARRVDWQTSLGVHRGTVFGGLSNALKLTYPSVHRLVGDDFFRQAAAAFARLNPPRGACFQPFCDGFAAFLSGYAQALSLPYLADVARFDLALERSAHRALGWRRTHFSLTPQVGFQLLISVAVLEVNYPVDAIRAALDQDKEDDLAALDMGPRRRWIAVWRTNAGPCSRPISPPAGLFLQSVLLRPGIEAAIQSALSAGEIEQVLAVIQADVLAAPYARVSVREGSRT